MAYIFWLFNSRDTCQLCQRDQLAHASSVSWPVFLLNVFELFSPRLSGSERSQGPLGNDLLQICCFHHLALRNFVARIRRLCENISYWPSSRLVSGWRHSVKLVLRCLESFWEKFYRRSVGIHESAHFLSFIWIIGSHLRQSLQVAYRFVQSQIQKSQML